MRNTAVNTIVPLATFIATTIATVSGITPVAESMGALSELVANQAAAL